MKWILPANFINFLRNYKEIELTEHAKMRLIGKQRGVTENEIKEIITYKSPDKIGLQSNGLYALFYEKNKEEYTKIIVNILSTKIFIVTFHNIDKQDLPRLK